MVRVVVLFVCDVLGFWVDVVFGCFFGFVWVVLGLVILVFLVILFV